MAFILIVEDDPTLQAIYKNALEKHGYVVETVTTGSKAIEILSLKSINMILLDIMLPGKMNGFDVIEQIRRNEHWRNIPIIILTNLDSEKQMALECGACDYFIKTEMDIKILIEKIQGYLSPES